MNTHDISLSGTELTHMTPDTVNNEQLCIVAHQRNFDFAVFGLHETVNIDLPTKSQSTCREIQVGLARHDERLSLDLAHALLEVPTVPHERNVAFLPGVDECHHVVRVPGLKEASFPLLAQEAIQIGVPGSKSTPGGNRVVRRGQLTSRHRDAPCCGTTDDGKAVQLSHMHI